MGTDSRSTLGRSMVLFRSGVSARTGEAMDISAVAVSSSPVPAAVGRKPVAKEWRKRHAANSPNVGPLYDFSEVIRWHKANLLPAGDSERHWRGAATDDHRNGHEPEILILLDFFSVLLPSHPLTNSSSDDLNQYRPRRRKRKRRKKERALGRKYM
jgi:hypothetical protein